VRARGLRPHRAAGLDAVEWSIGSRKSYADPFNDVNVNVIFTNREKSWRVPTFWRGGNCWTVRFAPPAPGEYSYRLESTDRGNSDLSGAVWGEYAKHPRIDGDQYQPEKPPAMGDSVLVLGTHAAMSPGSSGH
jgi:hypothetical protein